MSTTIHRLYRAAQPTVEDVPSSSMTVHPPSTSAAMSAGPGMKDRAVPMNASEADVCKVAVHPPHLKELVTGAGHSCSSSYALEGTECQSFPMHAQ